MKKNANNLLLWGFLSLMILPILLFAVFKNYVDTENYENRTLAQFPSPLSTPIQDFPSQFESYLGDNAPFRNQFMTLNAAINMGLLVIDSTDVLKGKENWLFLKDVSDSKSISDYQGLTYYTQQQQQEIIDEINNLQKSLSETQSELVIVFAPAKEGVYSNYMPNFIPVLNEQTRVELLVKAIEENTEVNVVFPRDALIDASESAVTYYKYDTHWNEIGAFVAAQEIYKQIGFDYTQNLPSYEQSAEESAPTDLANISATWAMFNDDVYYSVLEQKGKLVNESDDGYITQYSGYGQSACIVVTDSFGEALMPFTSAQFHSSISIHGNALNYNNLEMAQNELQQNSLLQNYVIIEVAERFSDTLLPKLKILNEYY